MNLAIKPKPSQDANEKNTTAQLSRQSQYTGVRQSKNIARNPRSESLMADQRKDSKFFSARSSCSPIRESRQYSNISNLHAKRKTSIEHPVFNKKQFSQLNLHN